MIKKKNTDATHKFRIGSHIRKWRNMKDIKQKDLANSLNLSEAAVSNIENDITNITVTQLEDISIALNVSIEQLLSDPQEKYGSTYISTTGNVRHHYQDNELVNAIIASLEKKDQQLQVIMQHLIHIMTEVMQHEKFSFNSSKQVASRA